MSAELEFISRVRDLYRFEAIQSHLGWDQETKMPPKGAEARGEILAWIATQRHQLLTDPRLGELISELEESDCDNWLIANVTEMRRKYDEAVKLPEEFVSEYTKACSESLVAWQEARANNDFNHFSSHLEKLIRMVNQKIEYLGCENTPYDVLLDEYEVGMKVTDYDPLFAGLKQRIVPLLHSIMESETVVPRLPEGIRFSIDEQEQFCLKVSRKMGFDFEAGRMDRSTHPFCAGLWPSDTRITTRFDELDPFSCLYAVMHESGHGLYEQGLPKQHSYTPVGKAVSLGVHESQSRLWENQIGRTSSFWKVALPWFKEHFSDFPDWDAERLDLVANEVKPDYIRVEADEITYNLHIMLRYEIEKKIFNEGLPVGKIPETWNSMFEEWFGILPPNDTLGCLQDVHWSMGAFGYFPTYTLGNLYAAQLLEAMSKEIGNIDSIIESGNWSKILEWLRDKVHSNGSVMEPAELIKSATGNIPSPEPFLNYIEKKYSKLYNL
ncbi:MAG: carboxypeptidase M32 [Candidatus Poseidoniaceae archaeon]|nr:carboxypeptidase M32 [Candidatus Poseidoniaceae archaeon]